MSHYKYDCQASARHSKAIRPESWRVHVQIQLRAFKRKKGRPKPSNVV